MENYMTLNKLLYNVWEKVRGNISDDDTINENLIENDIILARAQFLRRDFAKNRLIDDATKQRLSNIPMVEVTARDYIGKTRHYLRSLSKLPRAIEARRGPMITSITIGYNDRANIPLMDFNYASFVGNGRFNTSQDFAFLHEGYLYIFNPYISGLIEDGTYDGYSYFYAENLIGTEEEEGAEVITSTEVNFDISATDQYGNPIEGATVVISYVNKDGDTVTSTTTTDENGDAAILVPTLTEITYTITATNYDIYTRTTTLVIEESVDVYAELSQSQYDSTQYDGTQYN